MSERGRYDYDITTGRRSNEDRGHRRGGSERRSTSMFGGSERDSADRDEDRGRWTDERENFSWGRTRNADEGRFDRDRPGSDGLGDEGAGGQGERMGSGWGPDLGHRDRNRQWTSERETGREAEGERRYGRDDERSGLPMDETSRLIASNKVEGTAVYGRDGHRIGSIFNFMVDKLSGRVEYAVMRYGGTLGMGQRYYPLPWQILTYDTRHGGYRIGMTARDLRDAPSFDRDTEPSFDESYGDRVHSWYGLGRR